MRKLFFLLLIVVGMSACAEDPQACITGPSTAVKGEPVKFFGQCSLAPDGYIWYLPDLTQKYTPEVEYSFNNAGRFAIRLGALSGNKEDILEHWVEVSE